MTFDAALAEVSDIIRHHVARVLRTTSRAYAVRRDDLEQAARIGAWYAFRRYDASHGASWRTWATHWIRAYVEREAWGSTHNRDGEKATGRRATASLDRELPRVHGSGAKRLTLADLIPDPTPSPERRAIDVQTLRLAKRALLAPTGPRSRMDARRAMQRWLSGWNLRDVAKGERVSFQAVSLQMRERLAAARVAVEAA